MGGDQIWGVICFAFGAGFILIALIFAVLKDKAAMLISGFNTLSSDEREKYDKSKMSADMRNSLSVWAAILFLGGVFSYLFSYYFAASAFIIWLILFFREVKLTPEKAFEKYRI